MMDSEKTRAIVMRRTNWAEADRIFHILTPVGKMSVMAKGVRRERSKLAGGIELFSVSEVVVRRGKGELGILTSARLHEFYGEIMKDLLAMEFVGGVLKQASRRAEYVDAPEYFDLVWQVLVGVNGILKDGEVGKLDVVRVWWGLNVLRVGGEEVNLRVDARGMKLVAGKRYEWDVREGAFAESEGGEIMTEHIKLMRLMASLPLAVVLRVVGVEKLMREILVVLKYLC
jgi:DNA repair protein RecO (recombination protein O)